jgi:hypothetical protein
VEATHVSSRISEDSGGQKSHDFAQFLAFEDGKFRTIRIPLLTSTTPVRCSRQASGCGYKRNYKAGLVVDLCGASSKLSGSRIRVDPITEGPRDDLLRLVLNVQM